MNRTVRVFYDDICAHARPSCHKVDGRARKRRGFLMPAGSHPADARYVQLKGGIGTVIVAICPSCWPTVFDTAAWGRGARPRVHGARQVSGSR